MIFQSSNSLRTYRGAFFLSNFLNYAEFVAIIDEDEQLSRDRGPRTKKARFSSWSGADVGLSSIGRHPCRRDLPTGLPSHIHRHHQTTISSHIRPSNLTISPGEITTANFTVANLNSTSAISTTPTITLAPASSHIVLMISGVETGTVFTNSTDGKTVSFQPGGNTLEIRVTADATTFAGNYTIRVSLAS